MWAPGGRPACSTSPAGTRKSKPSHLKGHKHEMFVTEFFTQSKPVRVDDFKELGDKNNFLKFGPDIFDFVY